MSNRIVRPGFDRSELADPMTVGQLKALLSKVPDDYVVMRWAGEDITSNLVVRTVRISKLFRVTVLR